MFRKYIEVYTTLDLEKFFIAKAILADNHIQYKDTSLNPQMIRSFANFRGHADVVFRDGSAITIYRLSVKKGDAHKASFLLGNV